MTARPFVELTIPPYGGELDSWGKDPRGQWWGLVTWYEEVVQLKQMGPHLFVSSLLGRQLCYLQSRATLNA